MRLLLSLVLLFASAVRGCRSDGGRKEGTLGLRQDLGKFHRMVRRRHEPRRAARAVERAVPLRLRDDRLRPGRSRASGTSGGCASGRASRSSAQFTFHGEVELDPQRHDPFYVRFTDFYRAVDQEPARRADRRQAKRALYAGRRDVVARAADDRSQQPRQQHLVPAGISARRQRVGQARAVGVSRRLCIRQARRTASSASSAAEPSRSACSATISRRSLASERRC